MKKSHTVIHRIILCLCVLASTFFASCTQGVPEIRSDVVQLLRVQGPTGTFAERLSVFVFFEDADGPADYGSITISYEKTGYMWRLVPSNSSVRLRGSDRWVGSSNLAGPADALFPEGTYTLTVTDLAGNEALSSFSLVRPGFPDRSPVSFAVKGEKWELTRSEAASPFSRVFLYFNDVHGNLLYSWNVPASKNKKMDGTIESLKVLAPAVDTIQCYIENESGSAGVLLTPVHIQ